MKSINRKLAVELIPVLLILTFFIYTLFKTVGTELNIPLKSKVGFSIAASLIPIYFLSKRLYKYLLAFLLIAGTFNLVAFSPKITTWSFGIVDFMSILFQPLSAVLLIVYILIFRKDINSIWYEFHNQLRDPELSEQELANQKLQEIQFFMRTLNGKTDATLKQIVEDKRRDLAAREAAKIILESRINNLSNEQ